MPEFQRRTTTFAHHGIQWNRALDKIPEGQYLWSKNVRVPQAGEVQGRSGLTLFSTLSGITWVHSQSRLNNFDTTLVNFVFTYVLGADTKLYVGGSNAILTNTPTQNPVLMPPITGFAYPNTTSGSGNPLTMVDIDPIGSPVGWKYTGDSTQNMKVGYYPGDTPGGGTSMARALTMGMTPPVVPTAAADVPAVAGGGTLTGDYQWIFAYRNKFLGDRSNPSAATRVTQTTPALTLAAQAATMKLPTTPTDPQTGAADAHIIIDVYRFGGTIFDWRYVGTDTSGATFVDNLPDSAILTAPTPPEVTDPVTGVTRFNVFRPFITQDAPRYSGVNPGTVTKEATTGIWILTAGAGDTFNLNWLPGSTISINNAIFSIYQVRSTAVLELTEDPTGTLTSGSTYAWATQGALTAGQPLPHIWGPFGTGSGGAYVFGCGDANAAGTLYWTNGNDPDATDIVNSLVVCSPSEKLQGGCIYDGTSFCWSTERMFRIYPSLSTPGQFTTQEVPGGKGMYMEYSLTVQSNGFADQSVTWVGKDGIYNFVNGAGVQSMTDADMYPLFPHDNQAGINPVSLLPSGSSLPLEIVGFIDFSLPQYQRLTWYQGELFYDFRGNSGGDAIYSTLVYDAKQCQGWVSLDQYSSSQSAVSRMIEVGADNMKVATGNNISDYTGTTDLGGSIHCRLITRHDDQGDPRGEKLYGDVWLDSQGGGAGSVLTATIQTDYGTANNNTLAPGTSGRTQISATLDTAGLGILSRTIALDSTWLVKSTPAILYQYAITFVPKPEITGERALDKTDDGYNGAKYLRGFCIESNTFNTARKFNVLVDGVKAPNPITNGTIFSLTTNGQLETPFGIGLKVANPEAVIGYEFQIAIDTTDASSVGWEVFQVRWIWEKWPDLSLIASPAMNMGTAKPKYVRGGTIPLDTGGAAIGLAFEFDNSSTTFTGITTFANVKTSVPFAFNPPVLTHMIQVSPTIPARAWYEEIVWDLEVWPESTIEYQPFQNLGTAEPKYIRQVELPMETGGLPARVAISNEAGASVSFTGVTSINLYKTPFAFVPSTPFICKEIQINTLDPARVWFDEAKWDFEIWPDLTREVSPWMNAGDPGAKFMQGFVAPMDTGGQPLSLTLTYDFNQTVTVGPVTTIAGQKQAVPFSFVHPIIVHEFQITKSIPARVWYDEIKWIWEPIPELTYFWETQETNHDIPGFHYLGPQSFIAYIGGSDQPQWTVTTQYGSVTYVLPASNGVYTRAQVPMQPQKAKWRRYRITSTDGIRLYLRDTAVAVAPWGNTGPFIAAQPFGEISRAVGARI